MTCKRWHGLGTCVLEDGHDGQHHVTLTDAEASYVAAVGSGRLLDVD